MGEEQVPAFGIATRSKTSLVTTPVLLKAYTPANISGIAHAGMSLLPGVLDLGQFLHGQLLHKPLKRLV